MSVRENGRAHVRALLVVVAVVGPAVPHAGAETPPLGERVVRLRYLGAPGATRAGSVVTTGVRIADPTTPDAAETRLVVTSLYGLQDDPAAILVTDVEGRRGSAVLIARDRPRQVALLRTEPAPLSGPAPLASESVTGERVIAVSRTLTPEDVYTTRGIVSGVGRLGGVALQTDAAVSPLNYGGLLVADAGPPRVLGLLTPHTPAGVKPGGFYDSGIGFAIPWAEVRRRVRRMQDEGDLWPGALGTELRTDDPLREPAEVASVAPGSAAGAGRPVAGSVGNPVERLVAGDRIVGWRGDEVTAFRLRRRLAAATAGDAVELSVQRGDRRFEIVVVLGRADR